MPDGSYGGNPCGFVVESSDGNFYYSGDTALTYDMKLIGEGTKLNFAIFPIGDFFTMGIGDALRAAEFVGVSRFVGVHYDTFPPINLDREAALAARAAGTAAAGDRRNHRRLGCRAFQFANCVERNTSAGAGWHDSYRQRMRHEPHAMNLHRHTRFSLRPKSSPTVSNVAAPIWSAK
jgi:hypothetical protein